MPMRDGRRTCLKLLILVLVVLSAVPALAKANRPATPELLVGGTIVDTPAVQALLDQGAVIFDTRSPLNYGKGHLPGALCLPYQENSRYAVDFDPRRDQVPEIALEVGGAPLSAGHGFPARLVAPGRRGFWWVKWVTDVRVEDAPWWRQSPFPLQ